MKSVAFCCEESLRNRAKAEILNSILIKVNHYVSWIMLIPLFITLLSGYSMTAKGDLVRKITKGLIHRKNGYFLHRNASYILLIFVSFHISVNFRLELLKRRIKAMTLNLLTLAIFLLLALFFTALHF